MIENGPMIREQILALLSRKDYRPLNKIEIARKLGVSGGARAALRNATRALPLTPNFRAISILFSGR